LNLNSIDLTDLIITKTNNKKNKSSEIGKGMSGRGGEWKKKWKIKTKIVSNLNTW